MKKHLTYSRPWWAERLPFITAYANEETVLANDELPGPGMSFGADISNYTIAPKTITVNGFEVPAPETIAPITRGTRYYISDPSLDEWYDYDMWDDIPMDHTRLARGVVYLNKDHAITRAKAMLGIDPAEDCK
jgi:hypothetical protein